MTSSFPAGALVAAALFAISSPVLAQSHHNHHAPQAGASASAAAHKGTIVVEQAWSRATPRGAKVGGGYLKVTNSGSEADRLTGGSFPFADRVEVHQMSLDGTVMRMKPVQGGVEIRPGETVEFKPGGYHLMFVDLKEPLKQGQTVKGTLVFEKAGIVEVEYAVRSIGAQSATDGHQHH